MSNLHTAPAAQIAALWKAAASAPKGFARNEAFWACVKALEVQGFAGNARRFLERAAAW